MHLSPEPVLNNPLVSESVLDSVASYSTVSPFFWGDKRVTAEWSRADTELTYESLLTLACP